MPGRLCQCVLAALLALTAGACDDTEQPAGPAPLFARQALESGELVEVVACRHSHEHELRHVRVFAEAQAATLYLECVLGSGECARAFAPGALFVKLEYDRAGCAPDDLLGYTASLRLEDGASPRGLDWHWQKLDPALEVVDDGAPSGCVGCHVDHCAPPWGHDLRCFPD